MAEGAVYTVTLRSSEYCGRRTPAGALGEFLQQLTLAVAQSVRMCFIGSSDLRGRWPHWLTAASDLRLVAYTGEDETTLRLEAPWLGDAAPVFYRQREFWPSRPDERDTGLDLLADVISEVAANNADSEKFDAGLLRRLSTFRGLVQKFFPEIVITGRRYPAERPCILSESVVTTADELRAHTPPPRRVRVVGTLDMIRASTRAFAIKLESGQEIQGVFVGHDIEGLRRMWGERVLVVGKAIYRPSGQLLRIDADRVAAASGRDRLFSTIPQPIRRKFDLAQAVRKQVHKRGVAAIFGRWPGDESEEEVWRALEELS